jgi:mono/diheme cytochrome c family protein
MNGIQAMLAAWAATAIVSSAAMAADPGSAGLPAELTRGKYLVQISGCNDCHTSGYAESGGKIEESKWLLGDRLGWRGPWGTTYATNLRLTVKDMTAEQFIARARSPLRPPMPWFNLVVMRDGDVKAIYAYLKHLGPAGEPAPAYLPPDQAPAGPAVIFPAPPAH